MLRNVLAGFISNATERELYLPVLLLMPEMGFYDVHLIHGTEEFGKDFIAKRIDDSKPIQYIIQLKAGHISQRELRSEIIGQLTEALTTSLSHPDFDATLDRQMVLATTGDLRDNAAIAFQNFNSDLIPKIKARPVQFWNGEFLIDHFDRAALQTLDAAFPSQHLQQAEFLALYSQALGSEVTPRRIERYSRSWTPATTVDALQILRATIEMAIISQVCDQRGLYYESINCQMALTRLLAESILSSNTQVIIDLYQEATRLLAFQSQWWLVAFQSKWTETGDLVSIGWGNLDIVSYLVQCARICDLASLVYFLSCDVVVQEEVGAFLEAFVEREAGCRHPLSDRYAVSIVFVLLALIHRAKSTIKSMSTATSALREMVGWVCDRYEDDGDGLAGLDADELQEVEFLLGSSFDFVSNAALRNSFLVTALVDIAAFIGDTTLYSDILNDLQACEVGAQYWQVADSGGALRVDAEDVVFFPYVMFAEHLEGDGDISYADHIRTEPVGFRFAGDLGVNAIVPVALFLRDRYFPRLWGELLASR